MGFSPAARFGCEWQRCLSNRTIALSECLDWRLFCVASLRERARVVPGDARARAGRPTRTMVHDFEQYLAQYPFLSGKTEIKGGKNYVSC